MMPDLPYLFQTVSLNMCLPILSTSYNVHYNTCTNNCSTKNNSKCRSLYTVYVNKVVKSNKSEYLYFKQNKIHKMSIMFHFYRVPCKSLGMRGNSSCRKHNRQSRQPPEQHKTKTREKHECKWLQKQRRHTETNKHLLKPSSFHTFCSICCKA